MHIFEDSVISLGIFQLPVGATIPLHDHPGMTVISRYALAQAQGPVSGHRREFMHERLLCLLL